MGELCLLDRVGVSSAANFYHPWMCLVCLNFAASGSSVPVCRGKGRPRKWMIAETDIRKVLRSECKRKHTENRMRY